MFGIHPAIGRNFLAEEDQPGAREVAILGYGIWERRFGRDPAIIGHAINLDGKNIVVTGVLPRDSAFGVMNSSSPTRAADIYVPIAHSTARGTRENPSLSLGVMGVSSPAFPWSVRRLKSTPSRTGWKPHTPT
jgi:hypothetical protein